MSENKERPKRQFLLPWNHTGKPPLNHNVDAFIKENEENIYYVEEGALTYYGMNWYCVTVWLKE